MSFTRALWREHALQQVAFFAFNPASMASLPTSSRTATLLACCLLPLVEAYAEAPSPAMLVLAEVGGLHPLLITRLASGQYAESPLQRLAEDASHPELAATFAAIAQALGLDALPGSLPTGEPATSEQASQPKMAQFHGGARPVIDASHALFHDLVAGDSFDGDQVAGDKIVQQFFGGIPGEDGQTLLRDYLDALVINCEQLGLPRLVGRKRNGADQRTTPALKLQDVYTNLVVDGQHVETAKPRQRSAYHIRRLLERTTLYLRNSEDMAPLDVRQSQVLVGSQWQLCSLAEMETALQELCFTTKLTFSLVRPQIVTEAIAGPAAEDPVRLVLLGEPGSGKSSALRHLALQLALRLRGSRLPIPGWPDAEAPVPLLVPLGSVAAHLDTNPTADDALWQALGDVLEGPQGLRTGLRAFLNPALRQGGVLLLFDGLDELPLGENGGPRAAIAAAIARLANQSKARIVVTSRVLPYQAAQDWQLPSAQGWQTRRIQPLTFGQVRSFVESWYAALADAEPLLAQPGERAAALLDELKANDRLRPLTGSPLLLTMLALLHANSETWLPRERARVYDECVRLLLERWEPSRTLGLSRSSRLRGLIERLPQIDEEALRRMLHQIAFEAHTQAGAGNQPSMINRNHLRGQLVDFFEQVGSHEPLAHADTMLDMVREEAGLLIARDDDHGYAFPHLTFQEFLAACWLAEQDDLNEQAYQRWQSADRERWRMVLLLMVGRLRQRGPKDIERDVVPWLDVLCKPCLPSGPKDATQWRRDTVLAALSYSELGGHSKLTSSLRDLHAQVEPPLQRAIIELLAEPDPAITTADRVAAAQVLGTIGNRRSPESFGDRRYPESLPHWQREIERARSGETNGYFCRVEAGRYTIGAPAHASDSEHALAEQQVVFTRPFWVARLPVTVQQWQAWVSSGAASTSHEPEASALNQPVSGVTWHESVAFCEWLSQQLGARLRLPSEEEWEAAARGSAGLRFPWGNDWRDDAAASEEDRVARGMQWSVPVGSYPAGAAPCGALDMAGNVWEWTASSKHTSQNTSADTVRVTRGGGFPSNRSQLQTWARRLTFPRLRLLEQGFRVVLEA